MYCRSAEFRRPPAQRGVALVVALLVFALCAALLVALQRDFEIDYRRGANSFIAQQTWAYLLGAEELATIALQLDYDADFANEQERDDLTEFWARPDPEPYPLEEGGWLFGSIQDLQGRFNLNSLGTAPLTGEGPAAYSPAQQFFIRLLQALEGPEIDEFQAAAITEAVADWIDADDELRRNGAESGDYVNLTPSYRAANRPMVSVSELRAVAGVTPEIYTALRPLVTVWPRVPAKINIHTAPETVLRAINVDGSLQPLSVAEGAELVRARDEEGALTSIQDMLQLPVFAGASTAVVSTLLDEKSSYFLLFSRVEMADREQRMYSVLRRRERQIDVLARVDASLYDLPVTGAETQP